uniref:Uncharacterized protein n=1 Tax=Leersia perrieri TaxID=77586 RepID=A0A0D9WXP5_9ORYZ
MARPPRTALPLVIVVLLAAVLVAAASSEELEPSILIPVADTPLGSFEGADGPVADDAMDDEDAAPVGSPIGTTMTEPESERLSNAPPGSIEADGADTSGVAAAASTNQLIAAAAAVSAVAITAAGVLGF